MRSVASVFVCAMMLGFPSVGRSERSGIVLDGSNLRVTFDGKSGALRELMAGQVAIPVGPEGARLQVQDFPKGSNQDLAAKSCTRSGDKVVVAYTGDGLSCELEWSIESGMLRADGLLRNTIGGDRALVLTYHLPLAAAGLHFAPSLNARTEVDDKPASGSVYPIAAMCGKDFGVALAIPPTSPCCFKWVGSRQGLSIRLYLGLTPETRELLNAARFAFTICGCDPEWGFRDALRRYYAAYPQYYTHHGKGDGLWLFNTGEANPSNLSDYRYNETPLAPQIRRIIDRDQKAGVLTFPYMIVGQREIKHLATLPADYDAAMSAYERWTPADTTASKPAKESIAAGQDVYLKDEVSSSALRRADGQYVITIRKTSWGGNSVTFVTNPNPAIMNDKTGVRSTGGESLQRIRQWLAQYPDVAGIYIDSLGKAWCGPLNYRNDHFAYARYPLTFDAAGRPALHNMISHYEFLDQLRTELHKSGRLLFANGIYLYAIKSPEYADVTEAGRFFLASLLDVAGSESGVAPSMDRWEFFRACMGPKPYLLLNYYWTDAAKVETYLHQALCYDVFATNSNWFNDYLNDSRGYAHDKALYGWFVPLVRTLSKAGWQPVSYATSSTKNLRFERYGHTGNVYFTMYNAGAERECELCVRAGPLGLPETARVSRISGPGQVDVQRNGSSMTVRTVIGAKRTAVIEVSALPQDGRPGSRSE